MGNPAHKCEHRSGHDITFWDIKEMNSSWRSVLFLGTQKKYAKGEFVQPGKELLFLERGRMRLIHQSLEGGEKILWYIRDGCIFGETAFFDPFLVDYYCTCMTACSVYAFSPANMEKINKEHGELLLNLLRSQARKMRILAYQTSSLSQDSLLVRICKFLSQRIVPGSNPPTAKISISRQEMANLLGVHRVSLYRELRQQEEQGLLSHVKANTMTILRPDEFYKLAGMAPG